MIEERIIEGGLFRCCVASLHEHLILAKEPSVEGETLDCRYGQETREVAGRREEQEGYPC